MSRIVYHNNTCAINTVWYESHAQLLRMVCLELGQPDKILINEGNDIELEFVGFLTF